MGGYNPWSAEILQKGCIPSQQNRAVPPFSKTFRDEREATSRPCSSKQTANSNTLIQIEIAMCCTTKIDVVSECTVEMTHEISYETIANL